MFTYTFIYNNHQFLSEAVKEKQWRMIEMTVSVVFAPGLLSDTNREISALCV